MAVEQANESNENIDTAFEWLLTDEVASAFESEANNEVENKIIETKKVNATMDLQWSEKLNLLIDDKNNNTIEYKTTKWTRPILDTVVTVESDVQLPAWLIDSLIANWRINGSQWGSIHELTLDPNSKEATIRIKAQSDTLVYKGNIITVKTKNTLYLPEDSKLKFEDISSKVAKSSNSVASSSK